MSKFSNKIINGDCLKELKKIPEKTFDLVFADPPYNMQIGQKLTRQTLVRFMELVITGTSLKVLDTMMISVKHG